MAETRKKPSILWLVALVVLAGAAAIWLSSREPLPAGAEGGAFSGEVITKWTGEDARTMVLVEPFTYVDPDGTTWSVPAGAPIDGASIPRPLWTVVGSPFVGAYREATVVHDYFCDTRQRGWRETHVAFYNAMLASGVGPKRAKNMFAAVYTFGPRWGLAPPTKGAPASDSLIVDDDRTEGRDVSAEMEAIESLIAEQDPDLDALMEALDARADG